MTTESVGTREPSRRVVVAIVVVLLLALLVAPVPVRGVATSCFVALVPGIAVVRFLPDADRTIRFLLVVSISLSTAVCCSEALAVLHVWSVPAVALLLAALGLVAAIPGGRTP